MASLPTGTVTFLFTDIEGSTTLWQRYPDVMPGVIARHDAILRGAVEAHRGVVFRTVGDAINAAFVTATDALEAALAGQRALMAEAWPEGIELRVRMGLHTGAIDVQDGDYVGHTLNRMARVAASGHGRQILLSAVSAELVRRTLPPDTTLRDLGEHRLKDLVVPERIYMLEAPDLPAEFPPLMTLDRQQTNLPSQRGALVGRRGELEAAQALLLREDVGLVTFTGPGGTGKTSLALAVGHRLLERFADGVWFVPLVQITDPALVPSAISSALGVHAHVTRPVMEMLCDFFRGKELLLILDNVEQVLGAAPLIAQLLEAASGLTVLVTSRIALRLREEREVIIQPLAVPPEGGVQAIEHLSQYAAVELFIERAREVKPDFSVTNENAPAVAEICSRLDGLPLAIELAAARTRILPPQAMLKRLERRLPLLTGGAQNLPARQQTMTAAIAWSYDLLTEAEQILYRRLSVFAGGFTLEAAEAVCTLDGVQVDLLEGVTSLVDKSLLRQTDRAGEPRFSMLQTIREYGLQRLEESGEAEALRRAHARYFADLAEDLELQMTRSGPRSPRIRADAERDNFQAALLWSQTEASETETGLRLVGALMWLWSFGGSYTEWSARAQATLALPDVTDNPRAWAGALFTIGTLERRQGNIAQALAHLQEAAAIHRASGDRARLAPVLSWLGITAIGQGDAENALRWLSEAREVARSAKLPWAEATAVSYLADPVIMQGDLARAGELAQEALNQYQRLQDTWGVARVENVLAGIAWMQGDFATAHRLCANALDPLRQTGERWSLGLALIRMGIILLDERQYEDAEAILKESLKTWRDLGGDDGMILSLAGLVAVTAARGQTERAQRLYAAEPFRHAVQISHLDGLSDREFSHVMDRVRRALGDHPPGELSPLSLEEAVADALDDPAPIAVEFSSA